MKKSNTIIAQVLLAQIAAIFIWFLISVVQWSNNPKSDPGIVIPLIVRGVEAFSVFIVSSLLIYLVELTRKFVKPFLLRFSLLFIMYGFAVLASLLSINLRAILGYAPPKIDNYFFVQSLHFYIPLLLIIVFYEVVKNQIALQKEKENKLKAESLAQQAKWMMLRYQVNPHFLFNALNSIRSLVGHNDDLARKVVTELSEYFRYSLKMEKKTLVEISEEIKAMENYLEIQKIRFGNRLNISINVDPTSGSLLIPAFAIQTLVENAIKFGMKTTANPVSLRIEVFEKSNQINILVKNSGVLISPTTSLEGTSGTKTGIDNLKQRFEHLNCNYSFKLYQDNEMVIAHLFYSFIDK